MSSLTTVSLDVLEIIAIHSGVNGWVALCNVCKQFSKLTLDNARKKAIIDRFTIHTKYQDREMWTVNRKLHRDNDQPAYIVINGAKEWWYHGKRHRENDQPACEWSSGKKEWWYTEKK